MVTMSDEANGDTTLQPVDPVKCDSKGKSLVLSTSDYSAISIDFPVDNMQAEASNQVQGDYMSLEPVCVSVNQTSKYDMGNSQPYKTTRRRHSSISSTGSQLKLCRPTRTPSLDFSRVVKSPSAHQKPPTGLQKQNSERRSSRPPSGKRNQVGNDVKSESSSSLSCVDDVSVISCSEDTKENVPIHLECEIKLERESLAIKHLRKFPNLVRSKGYPECSHIHNFELDLCRWCDTNTNAGTAKSASSLSKKKNQPGVFNRLSKDGKEKMFMFFHCNDYSDYMYHYRIQHTVNNTGDLAKLAPVLGRDVPDPYLTKPSSVCSLYLRKYIKEKSSIVAGINPNSQTPYSLSSARKLEDGQKRSCPNLSPMRQTEESIERKRTHEVERVTPSQHILSVNDYMDSYLPHIHTIPRVPSRSDSSPALLGDSKSKSAALSESIFYSSQFDGEIVGMKHKLPADSAYSFSVLCKPTAGEDIYNELKSGSSSYRNLNSNRQKKVVDATAIHKSNNDTFIASPKCGSSKTAHSEKGCHGCTRITSLIRGQRKSQKPQDTKSKSDIPRQCKPLDDSSLDVFHRLQKLPIK